MIQLIYHDTLQSPINDALSKCSWVAESSEITIALTRCGISRYSRQNRWFKLWNQPGMHLCLHLNFGGNTKQSETGARWLQKRTILNDFITNDDSSEENGDLLETLAVLLSVKIENVDLTLNVRGTFYYHVTIKDISGDRVKSMTSEWDSKEVTSHITRGKQWLCGC